MKNYESKVCVACHPDAPKATKEQISEFQNNYLEWELIEDNQAPQLKKIYKFNDYIGAVDFFPANPSILISSGAIPNI